MHQPPTIPEGDEENEGLEQVGEGTRFPQTSSQQAPAMHDTAAISAELQAREDEGAEYENISTLQDETATTGNELPTDETQQADREQESIEKSPTDDEGEAGVTRGAENEEQLDEAGTLAGIKEEESTVDGSGAVLNAEKPVSAVAKSPVPPVEDLSLTTPRAALAEEHIKPDEMFSVRISLTRNKSMFFFSVIFVLDIF